LFYEVDAAVGNVDFELDLGVQRSEARQGGQQAEVGISGGDRDAQQAAGHGLLTSDGALGFFDLRQGLRAWRVVRTAVFSQTNLACGSGEQAQAQARFQAPDRTAHGGWCDAQKLGCGGEAFQLSGFAKHLDAAELNGVESAAHGSPFIDYSV
jgi:hypothetical protein